MSSTKSPSHPELLVLGNLLVDDVVFADGSTRMGQAGGAALYVALAASLFGVRVGLVSVRGEDYPKAVLQALIERGVAMDAVASLGRPGLRTWLLYEGRVRRVVHHLDGPSHTAVSPTLGQIPAVWLQNARAVHLAPMPFEVQRRIAHGLASRDNHLLVSLDPYELLQDQGDVERWRDLLMDVDLFFFGEDEMLLPSSPKQVLDGLSSDRLRGIALKHGVRGGIFWDAGRLFAWSPRESEVVDPTGAGDAFAAGFVAGRLKGEDLKGCLRYAVVAASFALEGQGADGLLAATPEQVAERLGEG